MTWKLEFDLGERGKICRTRQRWAIQHFISETLQKPKNWVSTNPGAGKKFNQNMAHLCNIKS